MRDQLVKAMQHNQIIDIMYISKDNAITNRRIKLIKIAGDTAKVYCFVRHAKRTFKIDNILVVYPVISKASGLNA